MYLRKLSLLHRPMSRIVDSLMSDSFIDIAPPDLIECVPISFASKPRFASFIDRTVFRRKFILSLLEILYNLSLCWTMFTGVSFVEPL